MIFDVSREGIDLRAREAQEGWQRKHDAWIAAITDRPKRSSVARLFNQRRHEILRQVASADRRKGFGGTRSGARQHRRAPCRIWSAAAGRAAPGHFAAPVAGRTRPDAVAILLRHPWLLPQVEEGLGLLDLPDGHATQLRAAILRMVPGHRTG